MHEPANPGRRPPFPGRHPTLKVVPPARESAPAGGPEDSFEPEDWYEAGCDLETEDPSQARDAYRRALELAPRDADAHLNLGRLLHEAGRLGPALDHYRLALEVRARDATAAYNLGVCLQDLGRTREAVRAYLGALERDPGNADAHFNLAQLYLETGKPGRAARHREAYERLRLVS